MSSGKESSTKRVRNDYEEEEEGKPKKIPRTLVEKTTEKRLIVILEKASLETVKVRVASCTADAPYVRKSFPVRLVESLSC